MSGSGTFTVNYPFAVNIGDKVVIDAGDEHWTGTVTAPGEFSIDPRPWPFGTVVRWPDADITALVLADDGETCHALDFGDSRVHTLKRDKYILVAKPDTP